MNVVYYNERKRIRCVYTYSLCGQFGDSSKGPGLKVFFSCHVSI